MVSFPHTIWTLPYNEAMDPCFSLGILFNDKNHCTVKYGCGSSKKKPLNLAGWNRYTVVLLLCLVAASSAHTQSKNTHQVSYELVSFQFVVDCISNSILFTS